MKEFDMKKRLRLFRVVKKCRVTDKDRKMFGSKSNIKSSIELEELL